MAAVLGPGAAAFSGSFPFVGRHREFSLLLAAIQHPPAVVLVEGEAGIGKSRLVSEAVSALDTDERRVLTGFCHPLREPYPYGPVVDALRKAGRWLPTAGIPPTAGALAPFLPDLADRLPAPPPRPDDDSTQRYQVVQAVRSLLTAIGPIVLVMEDMHWADEATRGLLLLLARDLPEQVSLVLTYRPEDLASDTSVLGAVYRQPPGTTGMSIRLVPMTEGEVQDLAAAALGGHATPALVTALHRRSEGLPLTAEEDLITLREYGSTHGYRDVTRRLDHAAVPPGLREAVTERLTALSEAGAAITDSAAVLAVPATEELLARVAGLEPALGAEGVTNALRASILRETDDGHYVFRHTLAQQVAYQHIPGPRRARLHRRAIEVLQSHDPAPLVQIAHHTLAAGDREAWFHRAEEAAEQAIAVRDPGTASMLLHQILEQPQAGTDLRSRAALTLARIVVNDLDYLANAAMLRGILADPRLPEASRGEIRLGLALLMINHGGDYSGVGELKTAVKELSSVPERAARAMLALALNERDGATRHAWEWMERAEHAVRTSPDEGIRAAVQVARLSLLVRVGDPTVWDELDTLPRRSDDVEVLRQTARSLCNVGWSAIALGQDQRAAPLLAESLEVARRSGFPSLECFNRIQLMRLDLLAGRWEGIEERFTALGAEYPDMTMVDYERTLALGTLSCARGRFARAADELDNAAVRGEKHHTIGVPLRVAAERVVVCLSQEAPADAWAIATPALAMLREAGTWAMATGLVPVAVEAALASGHRQEAEQLTAEAEQGLHGANSPAGEAECHIARGLLLRESEPARAAEHFGRAHRLWQEIGRPYEVAHAAEHLGHALARSDLTDAAEHLTEAIGLYRKLDATADLARCQHLQHELGLTRAEGRGRRGYGQELSPREKQVAELLVHGATNQDIAESLFLSPRTVEQHVANVLKKLHTTRKSIHRVFP